MGWEVEMGIPGRGTAGAKCWRWGNEGACRRGGRRGSGTSRKPGCSWEGPVCPAKEFRLRPVGVAAPFIREAA